jgi:hypothetical protein
MLTAGIAKLGELEATGGGLLVLGGGVVPVFAIRALQCDDLAHCGQSPSNVASHFGWQAACTELLPTRRDAGQRPLLPNPDFLTERGAVRPRSSFSIIQQNGNYGKPGNRTFID